MLHCYVSAIKDIKSGANLTNFADRIFLLIFKNCFGNAENSYIFATAFGV